MTRLLASGEHPSPHPTGQARRGPVSRESRSAPCTGSSQASVLDSSGPSRGSKTADLAGLFDAHAPALLRLVERLSGPGGHVEEIVQDVFLVAHQQLDAVAAAKNPRAWLYAVAINLARAKRRRSLRRRALWDRFGPKPETPDTPEQCAARSEHGATIRACIDQLGEKMREVVVLYELEGLEGTAIAGLLGVPVNTVWTRLRSGRAKLQKLLVAQGIRPGGRT